MKLEAELKQREDDVSERMRLLDDENKALKRKNSEIARGQDNEVVLLRNEIS